MATQYSPSKTPSRRVLGDLTPKAMNTPSTQASAFDSPGLGRAQSPLKQVDLYGSTAFVDKENIAQCNAQSKSRKRGIEEVDSAETVEASKMLARGRGDSLLDTNMRLTVDAMQRHTVAYNLILTRRIVFNKLKENNPIGLADPGSPTERNTPTPEPEPMPDSQRSNQSFSDLLNFEMCASQKSEHGILIEPARTAVPLTASVISENRKSRAEQLRTRLKFGLYKVKTNQIGKRDADIISTYEAGASFSSDALDASRSTGFTTSAELLGDYRVPDITISAPRHEQGPTFVKANLDPFRPIGKLGSAPIQFLPPQEGASISSRTIHGYDLSSSPPGADLPKSVSPAQLMSPVRQSAKYRISMGEHDNADIDLTTHERLQRLKEQSYRDGEITSSAVKGNAAEGLLELMHARR